jgi:thiol-disulfide isomerase/thioredoxin
MPHRVIVFAALVALIPFRPAAAQIPRKSPEYAVNMPQGQILLSGQRGKVVALMFILTTCGHCQKVTQILTGLQKEFGPKGFQTIAAAIEEGAARNVPGFVQQFRPSFPVGYTPRDSATEYLQQSSMTPMMMPQLVFIDRAGTLVAKYPGDDPIFNEGAEKNLRAKIESLLGAGAAAASKKKTATAAKK